ncbi:MAG: transposase [Labilithrix sp.]|nr:transposase [Labilithrix sp.]
MKLESIQPSQPTQNAHVESLNGRFRDECLAQTRFPTLARARVEIEPCRVDYNRASAWRARLPDSEGLRGSGFAARCRLRRWLQPPCSGPMSNVVLASSSRGSNQTQVPRNRWSAP